MFQKKVFIWLFLGAIVFSSACSSKFSKLQKKGTLQEKYTSALMYYKNADYFRAGQLFEELTPLLKGDSTAEMTQFYNAYCQYHQKMYSMSGYLFKNFFATYNNSPLAEEAYYMSAFSLYKDAPNFNLDQTSTLTAIEALQTFLNTYPESKYVDECTKNLAELRKRLELKAYERAKLYYKTSGVTIANFKAAVVAFTNFERDFPDSEYNEELAYLKMVSQYKLAENSYEIKQKERYEDAVKYYESFVDKYPKSNYLKQSDKYYTNANKALERITKEEREAKAKKDKEAAEKLKTK